MRSRASTRSFRLTRGQADASKLWGILWGTPPWRKLGGRKISLLNRGNGVGNETGSEHSLELHMS